MPAKSQSAAFSGNAASRISWLPVEFGFSTPAVLLRSTQLDRQQRLWQHCSHMDEDTIELLPCPHCGCTSAGIDADMADSGVHQVVCNQCAACGPIVKMDMDVIEGKEEEQAFDLWNMRVVPEDVAAAERRGRAEALRWVATELDAQLAEARDDSLRLLISASARSRLNTLTETATMCRTAAARAERGKPLSTTKESAQ